MKRKYRPLNYIIYRCRQDRCNEQSVNHETAYHILFAIRMMLARGSYRFGQKKLYMLSFHNSETLGALRNLLISWLHVCYQREKELLKATRERIGELITDYQLHEGVSQ